MLASNNSLNASGSSLRQVGEVESIYELQKILNDERNRAAQHKLNYQKLKNEMNNLQEKYNQVENELMNVNDDHKLENDEWNRKFSQLNRRLKESELELEDLRCNQVTEKRIEMIRLKIEEEFENVYQERQNQYRHELESVRSEMQKVRQENMFLKAELDHEVEEHGRIVEEMKFIHHNEITSYKTEKSRLLSSCIEIPQETTNFKELSKENGILKNQIKSLTNDLKETRAILDNMKSEKNNEVRDKQKQVVELTSSLKKTELDTDSIKKQLSDAHKEISGINSENVSLRQRVAELDRTNRSHQMRIDELVQKAKVDLNQLRLESARQKGDIERQKELQAVLIEELEYQLKLAGTKCGQLERELTEKDSVISRRESGMKEKEWEKLQQIQMEKMELETKLSEAESALREERKGISERMDRMECRVQEAEKKERSVDKENESTKGKFENLMLEMKRMKTSFKDSNKKCLEQEAELDECYTKLAKLQMEIKEKEEVVDKYSKLERQINEKENCEMSTLSSKEQEWRMDRERLVGRVQELEGELAKALEKCRLQQEEIRRKNKKHGTYFTNQKKKLQIHVAKEEELKVENELLRRNVPAEEYQKLRRELKELRRRHQEYRNIIMQSDDYDVANKNTLSDLRLEKGLEQLKQRLQLLDERQQRQANELEFGESQGIVSNGVKKDEYGPHGDCD